MSGFCPFPLTATPDKAECRCNCGYRCGGPGTCKLGVSECLSQDDGKHFVRDCGHDFSGPLVRIDDCSQSVVCQKCGMSALGHDCMVGP
jgi:hypothetical protein